MQIVEQYSHLNGLEYLEKHKSEILSEIKEALFEISLSELQKKISKEKTKSQKLLYSPPLIKKKFDLSLKNKGWKKEKTDFLISKDISFIKKTYREPLIVQKEMSKSKKIESFKSSNTINLIKDRVSVNLQLGKYAFVHFDIYNHISYYQDDKIDVGIIILPTKDMTKYMSTGVPIYERHIHEIIRCRGAYPNVPLVLIGVDR